MRKPANLYAFLIRTEDTVQFLLNCIHSAGGREHDNFSIGGPYWPKAGAGFIVASLACITIVLVSPWRHPQTRYRLLMAPIYLFFFVAVGWGAWSWGGWQQMGITSWWSALIVLPMLIPFWTVGNRRWDDGGQDQVGLNQ